MPSDPVVFHLVGYTSGHVVALHLPRHESDASCPSVTDSVFACVFC